MRGSRPAVGLCQSGRAVRPGLRLKRAGDSEGHHWQAQAAHRQHGAQWGCCPVTPRRRAHGPGSGPTSPGRPRSAADPRQVFDGHAGPRGRRRRGDRVQSHWQALAATGQGQGLGLGLARRRPGGTRNLPCRRAQAPETRSDVN